MEGFIQFHEFASRFEGSSGRFSVFANAVGELLDFEGVAEEEDLFVVELT